MKAKIDIFSKLLRSMEIDIGTRDLGILVLKALIEAIKALKADDAGEFMRKFDKLVKVISSTEPKFGILNYNFKKLGKEFHRDFEKRNLSEKKWKRLAISHVEDILKVAKQKKSLILNHAEEIKIDGKTVLLHDHSHTVQDALIHLKKIGRNFRVVIAEQDYEKTHDNIERMHGAKIPFEVVPSYMLSHIHDQIDMAFFGAVTLKDTMHFVMSPGAHSIISEFHIEKVPIYMFIDTTKFSLWKSQSRGEIFIQKHKRSHHLMPIEYDRIKYSHDRVPLKLFHRIVTDKGMLTTASLKKLYADQMKKYSN